MRHYRIINKSILIWMRIPDKWDLVWISRCSILTIQTWGWMAYDNIVVVVKNKSTIDNKIRVDSTDHPVVQIVNPSVRISILPRATPAVWTRAHPLRCVVKCNVYLPYDQLGAWGKEIWKLAVPCPKRYCVARWQVWRNDDLNLSLNYELIGIIYPYRGYIPFKCLGLGKSVKCLPVLFIIEIIP